MTEGSDASPVHASVDAETSPSAIRPAAWVVALALPLLVAAIAPWLGDAVGGGIAPMGNGYLPVLPLVLIAALAMGWNPLCARIRPLLRLRASRGELGLIAILLYAGAGVSDAGLARSWRGMLLQEDGFARERREDDFRLAYPDAMSLPAVEDLRAALVATADLKRQVERLEAGEIGDRTAWGDAVDARLTALQAETLSPSRHPPVSLVAGLRDLAADAPAEPPAVITALIAHADRLAGDLATVEGLRRGHEDAAAFFADDGGASPLSRSLGPALRSSALVLAGLLLILGFIAFSARQWSHHERLQHPLAQVPIALTDGSLLRNHAFRVTLVVMACYWAYQLGAHHGLHPLPGIRSEPLIHFRDLHRVLGLEPTSTWVYTGFWSAIACYPFVIGIAFLIAADVGFSVWGGFWFGCLICGWLAAMGLPVDFYRHVRVGGGGGGATLAMAVVVFWLGRHHYLRLLRAALDPRRSEDDRVGVWGARAMLVGGAAITGLVAWWGGNLIAGVMAGLLLLAFVVVIARVVAESGLACFQTPSLMSELGLGLGLGALFPARALMALLWLGQTVAYDTRENAAGYLVQSTAMAERGGLDLRRLLPVLLAVLACCALVALISGLASGWTQGGVGGSGLPTAQLSRALEGSHAAGLLGLSVQQTSIAIGFVAVFAVVALRQLWTRCPLHPLGLVVAASWPVHLAWGSLLLGWLAKLLVLRYGGPALFARLKPVAIGLILGDVLGYGAQFLLQLALGPDAGAPWTGGWP